MSTESATPPVDAAASSSESNGRGPFLGMLVIYVLWIAGLITLAITTSNPPQLNLAQVSRARLIVVASVEDLPSGRVRVEKSFSPGQPPEYLRVSNLTETPALVGRTYLLPLVPDLLQDDDTFRVVDDRERGLPPLIYPAGSEIEAQLLDWQSLPAAP